MAEDKGSGVWKRDDLTKQTEKGKRCRHGRKPCYCLCRVLMGGNINCAEEEPKKDEREDD